MREFIFPKNYFDDEVRCGFYVNGMMKRCWAAQLEVLYEMDKVCQKHGIKWFADCGTLIGAVRHGGYIPWDDDLDICMMRKDYVKFQQVAKKELPEGYSVQDYHNEGSWDLLLRINNSTTLSFDKERLDKYHDFSFIAGVDIFPLDFLPLSKEEEEKWREEISFLFSLSGHNDLGEKYDHMSGVTRLALDEVEKRYGMRFDRNKSVKVQLYDIMVERFSAYKDTDASEMVMTPFWLRDNNHRYGIKWYETAVELPFETGVIRAPSRYDEALRQEYGRGYIIPVRVGGIHDYPHYEEQEKMLKDANGGYYPYVYDFPKGVFEKESPRVQSSKDKINQFVSVMEKAHMSLGEILALDNGDAVLNLLTQCQNFAINLGTYIETVYEEGTKSVGVLEEYCEMVYGLCGELAKNAGAGEILNKLSTFTDRFKRVLEDEILSHREVVFMPRKASAWSALEPFWKEAVSDPKCKVYVMPLPYFDKNPDDSVGDAHYEGEIFPEGIDVIHYEKYDLTQRAPDEIVICEPYDECNYTSTVHPAFYSKNLKNYTKCLTYVPWFETDEINEDDARAKKSMEHYVAMPGLVYADKIILQSESMKKAYVDFLAIWAGEDTRDVWESKICFAKAGKPKEDGVLPASKNKTMLYYVSISFILEHKQKAIEKIKNVFDTFGEYGAEISVLLSQDPLIEKVLPDADPELYEAYCRMKKECVPQNIKEACFDVGAKEAANVCDGYYGSPGSFIQHFLQRKLPVMIQDVVE